MLNTIELETTKLEKRYKQFIALDSYLTRKLVSFQANKTVANFRWYKFKEAFSSDLVEYYLNKYKLHKKTILDPFAGVGTTLFAASNNECTAIGIELLPIGQKIIEARIDAHYGYNDVIINEIKLFIINKPWQKSSIKKELNILRITDHAYPEDTKVSIEKYLSCIDAVSHTCRKILLLALLSILEEVSYTRKDGQYLRWDHRTPRKLNGKKFDKGKIKGFDEAIVSKLNDVVKDIEYTDNDLFAPLKSNGKGTIKLIKGSCLDHLTKMQANTVDAVITSPPYCNRYDYTRTYALELALLGVDEKKLSSLRQEMLSCTVENKEKNLVAFNKKWIKAVKATNEVTLLKSILLYLDEQKKNNMLNNNGIIRMIKGYIYEMSCIMFELRRVIKRNGYVIMVNDNVRYAGVSIPVDLILTDIAEKVGFKAEKISVLPQKKGNSSQQMGNHGRDELRKCVYVWRKK